MKMLIAFTLNNIYIMYIIYTNLNVYVYIYIYIYIYVYSNQRKNYRHF